MKIPEDDKYDEFGNYIGPLNEEGEEDPSFDLEDKMSEEDLIDNPKASAQDEDMQIIERAPLHEEKQYYPELSQAYPNAEAMVQEEDVQELEEPMIQAPKYSNYYAKYEFEVSDSIKNFMFDLQKNPQDVRNIAIVGGYRVGKSKLCDLLIRKQPMTSFSSPSKKYTMDSVFERERKVTINVKPFSFPMADRKGKNFLLNVLDTPGHPDFFEEVKCALELVDGAVLVIDVVEGLTLQGKRVLEEIRYYNLNAFVVINKIDRLILEAKLPPEDAYLKIKLVIDELSEYIPFSPASNNIMFASTKYQLLFGFDFFASKSLGGLLNTGANLRKLLWGNIYFDSAKREFTKDGKKKSLRRTFVEFVLDPIYKIFSHVVAKEKEALRSFLLKLGLEIKNKVIEEISLKELLQSVFANSLCDVAEFVQIVSSQVINAADGNSKILKRVMISDGEPKSEDVYIVLTKVYPDMPVLDDPPKSFHAFGRVVSGVVRPNSKLYVRDAHSKTSSQIYKPKVLWPHCAHLTFDIKDAYPGSFVYMEGLGNLIEKQGIVHSPAKINFSARFRELTTESQVKVAIEPLRPSQLPTVMEHLGFINKVFPGLRLKTEESGEMLMYGRGELFMDTVLGFLRNFYAKCEIRLSEPSCAFAEAGIVTSQMFGKARSENKKNSVEFITEPLEKEIVKSYFPLKSLELTELEEQSLVSQSQSRPKQEISNLIIDESDNTSLRGYLVNTFKWDALTAKTFWCFGSSDQHPCLLFDDSFQSAASKNLLYEVKPHIINGFNWAIREGPLCEEPLREMKIRLTSYTIAEESRFKSNEQFVAMTRKAIHTAMLLATPRLLEPYYDVEVMCSQDALQTIYTIFSRRRGQLIHEKVKPGTTFYEVLGRVPILDSFGLETDIKTQTLGQATVSMGYSGWELMPGDPLDKDAKLMLLEPAEPNSLARDVMIKTRRRKGLSDDISLVKYFDDENILNAIKNSFLV